MIHKEKRVLWLLNHTTLRDFEAPLLLSLGYEVYTPKIVPKQIIDWRGSISYEYDDSLSLPTEVLQELNEYNFFEGEITTKIKILINEYFGTSFCVFHPELFSNICKSFSGRILLRAFGLDETMTYMAAIESTLGHDFLSLLQKIRDRFWFAQCYENLADVEWGILKDRAVFLPLGLPPGMYDIKGRWRGGINEILFLCPRIQTSPYYRKIYEDFKKEFGQFPYKVGGAQPNPVEDPNVLGFVSSERLDQIFCTSAVMFYHSQEARHLHYHPLEAMIYGMPVVFMRNGLLERLGGSHQPGACASIVEAKEKVQRILDGDQKFTDNIRETQIEILDKFSWEYNMQHWQNNFQSNVMKQAISSSSFKEMSTIAVFLPLGYRGGTLRAAKNIAKMIYIGSRKMGTPINVVFSLLAGQYEEEEYEDLLELGIKVRETEWIVKSRKEIEIAQTLGGYKKSLDYEEYALPTDGALNFLDCDYWLVVSDRLNRLLAPIRPYGMIIYDYIQRYCPQVLATDDFSYLINARKAEFVLCTTPQTYDDVLQYAGVSPQRAFLIPMEFDPLDGTNIKPYKSNSDYFIWVTNTSSHKNHLNALKALSIYYSQFDGKFQVIMTGIDTDYFDVLKKGSQANENAYIKQVRKYIQNHDNIIQNLKILGYIEDYDYLNALAGAKFLLHPTLIDNGTYSVVEAAYRGVPSLSHDYPQMRYIDDHFNLNMTFCNARKPQEIAKQLKYMEMKCEDMVLDLPDKSDLNKHTYEELALDFWSLLRRLV